MAPVATAPARALENRSPATTDHEPRRAGPFPGAVPQDGSQSQKIERRASPRRKYPYVQWVAPLRSGCLPPLSFFEPIRCLDISTGGIAYASPSLPKHQKIVIVLGPKGGTMRYLTAAIVRIVPRGEFGSGDFLIGCRFTGRIQT